VVAAFVVRESGAIDGLSPFPAVLVTGSVALLTTGGLLVLLDDSARRYARTLAGRVWPSLAPRSGGS
jgi:hypothetical protein